MDWPRLLACITGTVDQEFLLGNEYLVAENRILNAQIKTRLQLSDAERATLAEIGHRQGRKALEEVAATAKPDTILGWYRKLMLLSSMDPRSVNPRVDPELMKNAKIWCCGWRRKIPAGATIALSVHWPILDTSCQIRRWVISCVAMTSLLPLAPPWVSVPTNLQGESAEELWNQYIQLTEAEAAFRALKSALWIRPVTNKKT